MFGMALTRIIDNAIEEGVTSSHMCVGKRRTLWATIVLIFNHMTSAVSVFVQCDTIVFFLETTTNSNSNFRKVVRQHTEGMVGTIIWVLLEIYFSFWQWKNFENPLRIDKVIAMSLLYYFFGTLCRYGTVGMAEQHITNTGDITNFN